MSNNWLARQTPGPSSLSTLGDRRVVRYGARSKGRLEPEAGGIQVTNVLEPSIQEHPEKAASIEKLVSSQMWDLCGLRCKLGQLDLVIYNALVSLIFVFKATLAFVEDFPGAVRKPSEVWWMDFAICVTDLVFVILISLKPEFCEFWHADTGITGFSSKLGRAVIIAAYTTPLTPVETTRDFVNAVASAIIAGMKAVLALMALPSEKFPLGGAGEPFAQFVNCGRGALCPVRELWKGAE